MLPYLFPALPALLVAAYASCCNEVAAESIVSTEPFGPKEMLSAAYSIQPLYVQRVDGKSDPIGELYLFHERPLDRFDVRLDSPFRNCLVSKSTPAEWRSIVVPKAQADTFIVFGANTKTGRRYTFRVEFMRGLVVGLSDTEGHLGHCLCINEFAKPLPEDVQMPTNR